MAKLYFCFAPMNSGKSAEMLMKAYNFEERGLSVFCMKPAIDNRDGFGIVKSRIGIYRNCFMVGEDYDVYKHIYDLNKGTKLDWVLVDEAQFLKKEQVDQLSRVVDVLDINVLCYGLRADFRTELFEGSKRLFEIADSIEEIKQSCSCGRKAIVNARIDRYGNVVREGSQIEVGGNDMYVSLCRKCYYTKLGEIGNMPEDELPPEETYSHDIWYNEND